MAVTLTSNAWISHKLYSKGIEHYFGQEYDSDGVEVKVIALFEKDESTNLPGKILAVSGYTSGPDYTKTENYVTCGLGGSFTNKILTLNQIPYENTASLVSGTDTATHKAEYFAVLTLKTGECNQRISTGIRSDTSTVDSEYKYRGITTTNQIAGAGNTPVTLATLVGEDDSSDDCKVLLYGKLSNQPTIDAATNFHFSGANITFTENAN